MLERSRPPAASSSLNESPSEKEGKFKVLVAFGFPFAWPQRKPLRKGREMLAFHTPRTSDTAASMKALPKRKGNPAVATYYPGQFIKPQ